MSVEKNLRGVLDKIEEVAQLSGRKREEVTLVVISKGRSIEEIREAYFLGVRDFGENRVDEALQKMDLLPTDIRWHFIGKLQKNKVNKIIGKFALIHSIDTVELAEKVSRASLERGVKTAVLLEANTSGESTKGGLPCEAWKGKYPELLELKGIEIHGFMTMAPLTEEEGVLRRCFSELRYLQQQCVTYGGDLDTLSMGMTNDYPLAIQEGATLLRIGTAIFTPQ